jgi:hypothetical protein
MVSNDSLECVFFCCILILFFYAVAQSCNTGFSFLKLARSTCHGLGSFCTAIAIKGVINFSSLHKQSRDCYMLNSCSAGIVSNLVMEEGWPIVRTVLRSQQKPTCSSIERSTHPYNRIIKKMPKFPKNGLIKVS